MISDKKTTNNKGLHVRLLLALFILLAVPLTVFLTKRFILFTPDAAPNATIFFEPVSAEMPPNSVSRLMIDTKTDDLVAGRIDLQFNQNKVQLASEIIPNVSFTNVVKVTSMAEANSTGSISIVLAVGPGDTVPSGVIEFAKLPFTSVTTANTTATVNINQASVQLVNSSSVEFSFTKNSLVYTLNPLVGVPADTALWIIPEINEISVGTSFDVQIRIDTGVNEVVATELYMSFDQRKVRVDSIVPGSLTIDPSFFANPDEVAKTIDNTNGILDYSLVTLDGAGGGANATGVSGTGVVATVSLTALVSGTSTFSFLPSTIVGAVGSNEINVLNSTNGSTIIVNTVTPSACDPVKLGDIDENCIVNSLDFTIWFENFGIEFDLAGNPSVPETPYGSIPDIRADINKDGKVNSLDFVSIFENFEFAR